MLLASEVCKNKLLILYAASTIVFLSASLEDYHHRLGSKLGSKVKILGKRTPYTSSPG